MKYFKIVVLPLCVLLVSIVIVFLLKANKPNLEVEEKELPNLSVKTSIAERSSRLRELLFQGEVRAKISIDMVPQVSGKVVKVSDSFTEGGMFAKGNTLVQIDDADYRVALKSAQSQLAEAMVQLELEQATAASNAMEWKEIQGKNINTASALRLNKPQVARAKARLSEAQSRVQAAQLNVSRTKISVPFNGRVQSTAAQLGQFISRGASIGKVFASDVVQIRISMSDVQVSELGWHLGQIFTPETQPVADVSIQFAGKQYQWRGTVVNVDASIDASTRLVYATVEVQHPFEQPADSNNEDFIPLAPGMFVDVKIASSKRDTAIEIPREAVRSGSKVYVYENGMLRILDIAILFSNQAVAMIAPNGALQAGDAVILSPVSDAFDGMKLSLEGIKVDDVKGTLDDEKDTKVPSEAEKVEPQ